MNATSATTGDSAFASFSMMEPSQHWASSQQEQQQQPPEQYPRRAQSVPPLFPGDIPGQQPTQFSVPAAAMAADADTDISVATMIRTQQAQLELSRGAFACTSLRQPP